jgi:hypothetical protein
MTPEDRFLAEIKALQGTIDALPDEAVRSILADLDAARQSVTGILVDAGSYDALRRQQLLDAIASVMDRFHEQYMSVLAPVQSAIWDAGGALGAQPLVSAGLMFHVPQLSRRLLEAAATDHFAAIAAVMDAAPAELVQAFRFATLRGQSVYEAAQSVAGALTGPSTFGSIAGRAEAITRTELGRLQATATQAGLEESQRFVPDLQKQWRHSGNRGPYRRLGHIEANDQVRDVNDRFRVRPAPGLPYEELMYPRDPAASARNSVLCGCLTVPYREAWSGLLDQAA